jgi:hypothetical protein
VAKFVLQNPTHEIRSIGVSATTPALPISGPLLKLGEAKTACDVNQGAQRSKKVLL